jgi:hypothetical protein
MKQLFAAAICLMSASALGQQIPTPKPETNFAWVAAQAPEMKRVSDALSGSWETKEKFEPNDLLRAGASGSGVFTIRKGPGGNSLIIDYKSQSDAGPYSSTRIIYWDSRAGRYRGFYCDSLQPIGCGEAGDGKWDGNDLMFVSSTDGPKGPIQLTQRFSRISASRFTFSLDMVNQGRAERSLTIEARKIGGKR